MSGPLRRAAAVSAPAGALVLTMLPLVGGADPFDAALRVAVWLATVAATVAGARKPAALFAVVAALVEVSGVFTGSSPLWVCGLALLVAGALVLTRGTPTGLTGRFRPAPALPAKRPVPSEVT